MENDVAERSDEKTHKVIVTKNGPYLVAGGLPLAKEIIVVDSEHCPVEWKPGEVYPDQETYAMCRCGQSKHKPFCDGTHVKAGFDGTETASRKKYLDQAERISGRDIALLDAQDLCASARFCHQAGGVWELVPRAHDPGVRKLAIRIAGQCPSGRLAIWDKKSEQFVEPELKKSISLVEDSDEGVSGPIWLKGGVALESADGKKYETRNRVTLCRCGQSGNKPFCDGTHVDAGFDDGDGSIKR